MPASSGASSSARGGPAGRSSVACRVKAMNAPARAQLVGVRQLVVAAPDRDHGEEVGASGLARGAGHGDGGYDAGAADQAERGACARPR